MNRLCDRQQKPGQLGRVLIVIALVTLAGTAAVALRVLYLLATKPLLP